MALTIGEFIPNKTVATRVETASLHNGEVAERVRTDMIKLFNWGANSAARNLQKKIGPSEVGHACARNVGLKLAGAPVTRNIGLDVWPSLVGTALHAWMAETVARVNKAMASEGQPARFLPEQIVTVAPGILAGCGADAHLTGSCDLYDLWLKTVVDAKFLGKTQHANYVKGYVSEQYRAQIHLYGLGLHLMGYEVEHVSLAVFARVGSLQDLYVHSEPWDYDFAMGRLARLQQIQTIVAGGIDPHQIKATPTKNGCYFCPWRGECPEATNERSGD